jgi:NAD(P)-dependent dehydrogenase (short-subunit alcohol dehydrogenase family)
MAGEFEGPRTAIVTGGARRIGAAMVRALAADGWHVLIHYNRSANEAEVLAAELGGRAVPADLARPDAADRIFAAATGLPPVRLLINNASVFEHDGAADFAAAGWDHAQAVNLRAPALLTQAFAATGHGGLVVNMLDAKLSFPNPDFYSYTISKMGLQGLTELAARAYAPTLRVCGIAPAVTLVSGPQSPENYQRVHALNALQRGVTTDDIVAALRFLIGSPALTGHILTLDAGQRFLGLPRDVQFLEP